MFDRAGERVHRRYEAIMNVIAVSDKWDTVVRFQFKDTILADERRGKVIQEPLVSENDCRLSVIGKVRKVQTRAPANRGAIVNQLQYNFGK